MPGASLEASASNTVTDDFHKIVIIFTTVHVNELYLYKDNLLYNFGLP